MERACLLVDDEASVRATLPAVLAAAGFRVEVAEDLEEAERRLAADRYDLVITDLRLAGPNDRSGLAVVLAVKLRQESTPVVVLSAFAGEDARRAARELGADDFWSKSMPIGQLVAKARELGFRAG